VYSGQIAGDNILLLRLAGEVLDERALKTVQHRREGLLTGRSTSTSRAFVCRRPRGYGQSSTCTRTCGTGAAASSWSTCRSRCTRSSTWPGWWRYSTCGVPPRYRPGR